MSLRTIIICQNEACQTKGAKSVQQKLESLYEEEYEETYPDLKIAAGDCMGDCEMGPIVKVNDSIILRNVNEATAEKLLSDPKAVLGEVMHVLEEDRDTFDRIIKGELF